MIWELDSLQLDTVQNALRLKNDTYQGNIVVLVNTSPSILLAYNSVSAAYRMKYYLSRKFLKLDRKSEQ